MTLLEMQYLVTIAKCKNLTKAAEELYITQPTLSKFLAAQESHYGVPLFKRTSQGYLPTLIGQRCLDYATEILNQNKSFDFEIAEMIEQQAGTVSVGFTYMRIATTLPKSLPIFKSLFPKVSVNIVVTNSTELEKLVKSGELELAFLPSPDINSPLHCELVYPEEILLAAPPLHDYSDYLTGETHGVYPVIDLKRLKNEMFILQPSWSKTRQIAEIAFTENGFHPSRLMELENVIACIGLVSSGYGYAFVAESLIALSSISSTPPRFFAINSSMAESTYCAVYRKNVYVSKYMRTFIDLVKEVHREQGKRLRESNANTSAP